MNIRGKFYDGEGICFGVLAATGTFLLATVMLCMALGAIAFTYTAITGGFSTGPADESTNEVQEAE